MPKRYGIDLPEYTEEELYTRRLRSRNIDMRPCSKLRSIFEKIEAAAEQDKQEQPTQTEAVRINFTSAETSQYERVQKELSQMKSDFIKNLNNSRKIRKEMDKENYCKDYQKGEVPCPTRITQQPFKVHHLRRPVDEVVIYSDPVPIPGAFCQDSKEPPPDFTVQSFNQQYSQGDLAYGLPFKVYPSHLYVNPYQNLYQKSWAEQVQIARAQLDRELNAQQISLTGTQPNQNTYTQQNQNSIAQQNQNTYPQQNQNSYAEQNQNTYPQQNQNSNAQQNQNTYPQQNQNSNAQQNQNTNPQQNQITNIPPYNPYNQGPFIGGIPERYYIGYNGYQRFLNYGF